MVRKITAAFLLFLLFWDMICCYAGDVETVKEYNDEGKCILEMYFKDGLPYYNYESYYGVAREFHDGHCTAITYLNENGFPMLNKSGYARKEREYDAEGHIIQELYYDLEGSPTPLAQNQYGIKRTAFDNSGNCTEYTYIGINREPVMITSGYSTVKSTYNEKNKVEQNMYFDIFGRPAQLSSGQYGDRREYDEDGHEIKLTYLDEKGRITINNSGYSVQRREYNGDEITAEWFCNAAGTNITIRRGQAGRRPVYENGVIRKWIPIDSNGKDIFLLNDFLNSHPQIVVLCAAAAMLLCFVIPRRGLKIYTALYFMFILYMTLYVREPKTNILYNLNPLRAFQSIMVQHSAAALLHVLYNVILFIPFGWMRYFIRMNTKSTHIVFSCIVLSACIELVQYLTGLGFMDVDDILFNGTGAIIGVLCARMSVFIVNKVLQSIVIKKLCNE